MYPCFMKYIPRNMTFLFCVNFVCTTRPRLNIKTPVRTRGFDIYIQKGGGGLLWDGLW